MGLVPFPGPLPSVAARVVESSGGLVYLAIVGMHVAFEYQNHLNDRQVQTAELERLLAESRFETLRTQFQPYLLSKALNANLLACRRRPADRAAHARTNRQLDPPGPGARA